MRSMSYLSEGFRIARRHKRLVLGLWLVPLIPALILGAMAASNIAPDFGKSLFADRTLDGDWFVVWMEFRSSPADALEPILGLGVVVMVLLTLLVQVIISAGVVEVLLEREDRHPFVIGIHRNLLRFMRTAILLAVATAVPAIMSIALVHGSFKLAEAQSDGRLDLIGVALAAVLFIVLWAPLDLASDLSRISAARRGDRSMVRGFFRAWWAVIRRPETFVPLYLIFLLLPLSLHLVYSLVRAPWTPASVAAIAVLVVAQQLVMVVRAALKLGFWGAEVAAFRGLEEPRWCRSKVRKRQSLEESPVPGS